MQNKLFIVVLVLVVILAIASRFLFSNLDSFVKAAIEEYGSQATGTEIHVSSVRINLSMGEGSISGLIIHNPKGFSSPQAFEMDSISVIIDTRSVINQGPIVIKQITIEKPQVTFEVTDNGSNNLQTIANNIRNYGASKNAGSDNEEKNEPERKIIISDLTINNGQVSVSNKTLLKDKTINAPLSSIHLTNIGKDGGGVTAAQATKQVLGSITSAALKDANAAIMSQLKNINLNSFNKSNVNDTLKGLFR